MVLDFKANKSGKKYFFVFASKCGLFVNYVLQCRLYHLFFKEELFMHEFEPQVILTAVSIFFGFLFTAIAAMWIFWKAISESQAKTNESQVKMHESLAEVNKTISELQTNSAKSLGELQTNSAKSLGELKTDSAKSLGELKTDSAKSFAEVRSDLRAVNTRMDGLDKRMDDFDSHMSKRMDDLGGQVRDLKGEVRGINEFLRRDSVKNTEDDKES